MATEGCVLGAERLATRRVLRGLEFFLAEGASLHKLKRPFLNPQTLTETIIVRVSLPFIAFTRELFLIIYSGISVRVRGGTM